MTFSDIQSEVAERLNLTSDTALARIGRSINERYRWLASDVGLHTTKRGTVSASTTIGNRNLIFLSTSKIYEVFDPSVSPIVPLDEKSFFEIRRKDTLVDPARAFAIHSMGANSVTIFLDGTPASVYTLTADAEIPNTTLSDTDVPSFPENFHDILTIGAMAIELYKMERYDLATVKEKEFEGRLGQLKLFIATSAYNDIYQGKTTPTEWYNR